MNLENFFLVVYLIFALLVHLIVLKRISILRKRYNSTISNYWIDFLKSPFHTKKRFYKQYLISSIYFLASVLISINIIIRLL